MQVEVVHFVTDLNVRRKSKLNATKHQLNRHEWVPCTNTWMQYLLRRSRRQRYDFDVLPMHDQVGVGL